MNLKETWKLGGWVYALFIQLGGVGRWCGGPLQTALAWGIGDWACQFSLSEVLKYGFYKVYFWV